MQKPLISVIIVTWNNKDDILECIKSFIDQTYENLKILIVDNNSSDNTVELIEKHFPRIEIVKLNNNNFLAKGNNIGIIRAIESVDPQFILIVNPDTKAEKKMIDELYSVIEKDQKCQVVGPKILYYTDNDLIYSAGILYDGFMQATQRGNREVDKGQYDKIEEVFGVEGTCMLIRSSVFKDIGFFWDRLQMYSEDVEFFIRVKKAGYKVKYVPKAILWHKVMSSTKQNKDLDVESVKIRNWLLIALRHYRVKSKLAMFKHYLLFKLNENK